MKKRDPDYSQQDLSVEWQAEPRADKARRGISNAVAAGSRDRKVPKQAKLLRCGQEIFLPVLPKKDELHCCQTNRLILLPRGGV